MGLLMATDPQDTIDDLLTKPKQVSSDAGSVTNVSVYEVIAADKHARKKAATSSSGMGLRFGRFTPPEHF
jgi:hypothetical protein